MLLLLYTRVNYFRDYSYQSNVFSYFSNWWYGKVRRRTTPGYPPPSPSTPASTSSIYATPRRSSPITPSPFWRSGGPTPLGEWGGLAQEPWVALIVFRLLSSEVDGRSSQHHFLGSSDYPWYTNKNALVAYILADLRLSSAGKPALFVFF